MVPGICAAIQRLKRDPHLRQNVWESNRLLRFQSQKKVEKKKSTVYCTSKRQITFVSFSFLVVTACPVNKQLGWYSCQTAERVSGLMCFWSTAYSTACWVRSVDVESVLSPWVLETQFWVQVMCFCSTSDSTAYWRGMGVLMLSHSYEFLSSWNSVFSESCVYEYKWLNCLLEGEESVEHWGRVLSSWNTEMCVKSCISEVQPTQLLIGSGVNMSHSSEVWVLETQFWVQVMYFWSSSDSTAYWRERGVNHSVSVLSSDFRLLLSCWCHVGVSLVQATKLSQSVEIHFLMLSYEQKFLIIQPAQLVIGGEMSVETLSQSFEFWVVETQFWVYVMCFWRRDLQATRLVIGGEECWHIEPEFAFALSSLEFKDSEFKQGVWCWLLLDEGRQTQNPSSESSWNSVFSVSCVYEYKCLNCLLGQECWNIESELWVLSCWDPVLSASHVLLKERSTGYKTSYWIWVLTYWARVCFEFCRLNSVDWRV